MKLKAIVLIYFVTFSTASFALANVPFSFQGSIYYKTLNKKNTACNNLNHCQQEACIPSITCNPTENDGMCLFGFGEFSPIPVTQYNIGVNTFAGAYSNATIGIVVCVYQNVNQKQNYSYTGTMAQGYYDVFDNTVPGNAWELYPQDSNSAFCPNQHTQTPDSTQCTFDSYRS